MSDPRAVRVSVVVYRFFLRVFPRRFRRECAPAMTQAFREQCRAIVARRGTWGLVGLWPRSVADLVTSAGLEHADTHRHPAGGSGRRKGGRFDGAWRDVRDAVRSLWFRPGLVIASVLTLAVGVGANGAMFSLVYSTLLRPLPIPEADRVVALHRLRPNGLIGNASYPVVEAMREPTGMFAAVAGYSAGEADLVGVDEPQRVEVVRVTDGFFAVLEWRPVVGRLLIDGDAGPAGRAVAVLSHAAWVGMFGGDTSAVGRSIRIDDEVHTVVGVAEPLSFGFPSIDVALWVPVRSNFGEGSRWLRAVGRLAPRVSPVEAQASLDAVAVRLARAWPEVNTDRTIRLESLHTMVVGAFRPALMMFMAAMAVVLIVALANVTNLFLVRAVDRRREYAIRSAVGASQGRLIGALTLEGSVMGALGGLVGLAVARWTVTGLVAFGAETWPRRVEANLDPAVIGFIAVMSILSGSIVGALGGGVALKGAAAGDMTGAARVVGRHRHLPLRWLSGVQVSAAAALLVTAGLMAKSVWRLSSVDPGFATEQRLAFRVSTPASSFPDRAGIQRFHEQVRLSLASLPGVNGVASVNLFPFHGGNWCNEVLIDATPETDVGCTEFRNVSPNYFPVLGVPVLAGRGVGPEDGEDAPPVAVVNATLARRGWADGTPVGARVTVFDRSWEVVGVVADVRQFSLDRPPEPVIYLPQAQIPLRYARYVVRTVGDPLVVADAVRAAIWRVDPNVPIAEMSSLEGRVTASIAQPRFRAILLGGVGFLALIVSVIGLYGVIAFSVARQTRELGLRMALGALPRTVLRGVLGQGATVATAGAAGGLVAALGIAQLLRGFLYGTSPVDPTVFAAAFAIVLATGILACLVPARRATRVDPMVALGED